MQPRRGRFRIIAPLALAMLGATGCSGDDFSVQTALSEQVSTVVEITWSSGEEGTSWVEYGTTEDRALSTNTASGTDHRFELYGLPSLSKVYYRAVTETDGAVLEATGTVETGSLPAGLSSVEVTVHEDDLISDDPYLLIAVMGEGSALLVVDRNGEVVWYRECDDLIESDSVLFSDVEFAHGSTDILFNINGTSLENYHGAIFRTALDGELLDRHDMDYGHHAFLELDEGQTYAYLSAVQQTWYDEEEGEDVEVVGDAILEVPVEGGEAETVFDAWDWSEPEKHDEWESGFWDVGHDWTHANGLFYQESTGHYFMSMGYVNKVLEIDRETGEVVHEYSGDGDVQFAPDATPFGFPHDPSITPDETLLVFSTPEDGMYNEAIEYSVDLDQGLLEEVWAYGEATSTYSVAEGRARRLENGNTLVSWSAAGTIREVTAEGELAWELQASLGGAVVGASLFEDFYDPGG